jgi:uncharacterized protein (TIGR00369 family)
MVRRAVPFVGAGGVRIHALGREGVVLSLPMRRRVSNHIGSAHAAAVALLAETAGGLAFAMHLPAARTPVVKCMELAFLRIARGCITATAQVPDDAVTQLHDDASGELVVPVALHDEAAGELVVCRLLYAWFTRGASQLP